jgi:hypothetical protein
MKWLFALSLAFALAACAESGNFDLEKPLKLATPAQPTSAPATPAPQKPTTARVSRADANEGPASSSLMECGSEACKTQCSPALKKDARPKWCMYFREPVDRHASEIQGSSTE